MGLEQKTKELGPAYFTAKQAKNTLERLRLEFFDEIDAAVKESDLARKTIEIPEEDDIEEYVALHHPGWTWLEADVKDGRCTAIIEEDPEWLPYVYISEDHKFVFERRIKQATTLLDDERLKKEDPALWKRVTKPTRILKPLEDLDPDDFDAIQDYTVPGKLSKELAPVRKPKAEELDA